MTPAASTPAASPDGGTGGGRHWLLLPAAVLLTGIVAATTAGVVLHRAEQQSAQRSLDRRADMVQAAVSAEATRHVEAVRLVAAALSAQPDLTAAGFAAATAPLPVMRLNGATAIAFLVPAAGGRIAQTEAHWRRLGATDLRLRPAGSPKEHVFSVFQRSVGGSGLPPTGIDVSQAAEPTRALLRSRVTGDVTVSAPYRLLADRNRPVGQQQQSFVLSAPVYAPTADARAGEFRGWVLMGLRGQDFMGATLQRSALERGGISLLAQHGTTWQEVAVHRVAGTTDTHRSIVVTVADRQWRLEIEVRLADRPGGETHLDDGMVGAGLLLTVLLTILMAHVSTARRRAQKQVLRATAELRAAEAEARRQASLLSSVLDNISDGVGVVDRNGAFLLHNPAARRILGVTEDVNGVQQWQEHYGVLLPDGVTPYPADEMPLVRAIRGEATDNAELLIRNAANPDGVWLNVSARPLDGQPDSGGAVAVFHDITAQKRAAQQLRASEERLRLLLDGARDHAIVMLDPHGRVASWSGNAERIIGHCEAEALGSPYATFFPPGTVAAEEPERILRDAARTGRVEVEGVRVRRDGTTFWAHAVLTALTGPDGAVQRYVEVTQDVSARRRAEARFRNLLELAPDAIVGTNADGRIVLVNSRVEPLFGYPREELLGQPIEILVPEEHRAEHARHRAAYLDHPVARPMGARDRLTARRRDGSTFPAEISLSTLDSEEGIIISGAIRDITERVEAQRELRRLNARLRALNTDLERRVAERTRELAEQTRQLAAANEELEAFSYSVSHDLRAPLRAVDGFASVLTKGYADRLDDTGRRYLDKVRGGAQQMGQLIDGLLEFSRLQRQEMLRQPVDLARLVRESWDQLAVERADRDVTLEVADLPVAYGDARLLGHVVNNLVGNAVKYTRERESAVVRVDCDRQPDGEPVYFVRDNGAGFDMRYADKLFKVFQRLHRAEEYEGTGIGLALSARILHRHGGRIWAEGAPGAGATFYFTVPGEPAPDGTEPVDRQAPARV